MSRDGDSGTSESDRVLVAEYALGLLDAAEHAALARRLAAEPGLAAELRLWQVRLSSLDDEFAEAKPPAGAWPEIDRRLFGSPPGLVGWWNSLPLWRALAATGLSVALVAMVFNLLQPPRLDPRAFADQLVATLNEQARMSASSRSSIRQPAASGSPGSPARRHRTRTSNCGRSRGRLPPFRWA
jgi:anti-sigma-K factor RskA